MNFKLFLLSMWTPKYFLKKELNHLAEATINELDNLLKIHSSDSYKRNAQIEIPFKRKFG